MKLPSAYNNTTFPLPNADITGIGVVLAFSIAAYTSFFLALIFYVLGSVPPHLLNNFDKAFLKFPARPRLSPHLVKDFQKGVLVVSEQQLVAALGILGAGLAHMSESIVFDFHFMVYLAWMASNMHLSSLSILRPFFHERPRLRALRLLSMLILLVTMCIAIYPTTAFTWAYATLYDGGVCPAADDCPGLTESVRLHWHRANERNKFLMPQGVVAYAILIVGHVWQAAMLFPKAQDFFRRLSRKPLHFVERALLRTSTGAGSKSLVKRVMRRSLIGVYMFTLAVIELCGSWAFLQFIMAIHLAWSSFQLFVPRFHSLPACVAAELNEWRFGQILPMLLLLAPLLSIATYYLERPIGEENGQGASGERGSDTPSSHRETWETHFPTLLDDLAASNPNDARDALHRYLFSTLQLKLILSVLCVVCCLSVVGYIVAPAFALSQHRRAYWVDRSWHSISWNLWPDVIATFGAFGLVFLLSILCPFVGSSLRA